MMVGTLFANKILWRKKPMITEPKGTVVVAVGFDERTPDLALNAQAMSHQFGMTIHFVHAIEPPVYDVMAIETPAVVALPLVVQEEMARVAREREEKMNALIRQSTQSGCPTTGVCVEGDPIRTLINEAVRLRANLILTANNLKSDGFFPLGLSTSISLMHDAPLPVMVLGKTNITFSQKPFKILIADDLTEGSSEAAQKAFEFASLIPGSKIRQVHVHGDLRETLRDTWRDMRSKLPFFDSQEAHPDSYWIQEHEARLTHLKRHGLPWRRRAETAGVQIENDIRMGAVEKELAQSIQDFKPDIVFFGRHRLLKTRPFLIGRVPGRIMLKDQYTVVLIPPTKELFARVPFPSAAK
jgi:nucleotide-binding universal stress UspA family protein